MLTLVSKDSVKISDHFGVLCVLIACMVLEIINQMSKNQKSSLIVWNTVGGLSESRLALLPGSCSSLLISSGRFGNDRTFLQALISFLGPLPT